MSGHSKWATTKHHKAIVDAKKGKVFSKHSKLIAIAARSGGDPALNSTLALAIERAKKDSTPNSNIERAIKTGTGELKDGAQLTEAMYEGYGPGGIAIYIQVITDNKNRAVANIRHILEQAGGSLGTGGSVAWMFKRKGTLEVPAADDKKDDLMLQLIDAGAEDVKDLGETLLVVTDPNQLPAVKQQLDKTGITHTKDAVSYIPDSNILLQEEDVARRALHLMDALDDDDDVQEVYSNFDIPDALMEKLSKE